jgi:hypothetical protein
MTLSGRGLSILVALAGLGLWGMIRTPSAVNAPPGVVAPADPQQVELRGAKPIERDGFSLQPVASFNLQARVLGVETYSLDRGAAVAPVDIAFGWGRMSDTAVIERLNITQGNRWYRWEVEGEPPIPVDEIYAKSANMHLIPANDAIESQLERARPGQVMSLRGALVDVKTNDGTFWWNTSRSRTDRGEGACELIYVEAVSVR